jgi:hypothetical protein
MIRRSLAAFLTLAAITAVLLFAFRDIGEGGAATPESNATESAAEDPTTSSTLGPNEVSAGDIADRIAAAWTAVTSYRSTTRVFSAGATPEATPGSALTGTAERYVILPDQKRIVIYDGNGTIEIVFSGGALQQRQTPYGAETGEWVTIDPTAIDDNDPFALAYASILAPEQPPYSALGQRQRDRIGTRGDTVNINGQECVAYQFPEVTVTGDQIRITIYLGPDDLPCRIETLAGVSVSQTDYVFNQEVAIATPES